MSASTIQLTNREGQVVRLLGRGLRIPQIAEQLLVRDATAKGYVDLAKGKLGVRDVAALVHNAYERGAVSEPEPDHHCSVTLSLEQRQLLPRMAEGKSVSQMATELRRPVAVVRRDAREMLAELGATNSAHAMTRARQLGLLGPRAAQETP
ncbi:LuxR C-terminal-related transcriptional regulator [Streptomyces sp. NEAU-S7GS2]|uniref:helix-turn-helix domain-containing protein n=1 Tax=Streptomyces sp. NEAU-S7GS2 TaxID=2202000 RepID=UPI000D7029A9|nr:LuxR C-terminal-related transcriptional regulator [Streptomyces sp. NEAU-S7GS2]AWN24817.1 hypothetical protein DKG71_00260 [Streptomyces sp. NEAU-S7GS2]